MKTSFYRCTIEGGNSEQLNARHTLIHTSSVVAGCLLPLCGRLLCGKRYCGKNLGDARWLFLSNVLSFREAVNV